MTVGELIEQLEAFGRDVVVLVEAQEAECGYMRFEVVSCSVWPKKPEGYWDGEYGDRRPGWGGAVREPSMPAVVLERRSS